MKKNIKVIIGIALGIILGASTIVGAATIFRSEDITYSSPTNKTNVKDSLDELYDLTTYYEFYKPLADQVELGDYISMTPTSTSYLISSSLTGYKSFQEINPSELNLWRVIKKNEDGSVEVISEYVSSVEISFTGKLGYINLVGGLNQIAAQYTNKKYVESARHYGSNSQTEFIADRSKIDSETIPWKSTTSEGVQGYPVHGNQYEQLGGGNALPTGWDQVVDSVGTIIATTPSGDASTYWAATRIYWVDSDTVWNFAGGRVTYDGRGGSEPLYASDVGERTRTRSIRPILTLKVNNVIRSGDGKSAETAYTFE